MFLRYTRLRKRHQKDVPEGKDFPDVMFLGFWKFSFTYFTKVTRDQKSRKLFLAVSSASLKIVDRREEKQRTNSLVLGKQRMVYRLQYQNDFHGDNTCSSARDFADELDEYDMVGIQIVGDKMRRRLAEKHRMLELQQSRSSLRYALTLLPCTDLKRVITLARLPVPWIRSAVSGTPSLPYLVLN
jgi:hypothetical protein